MPEAAPPFYEYKHDDPSPEHIKGAEVLGDEFPVVAGVSLKPPVEYGKHFPEGGAEVCAIFKPEQPNREEEVWLVYIPQDQSDTEFDAGYYNFYPNKPEENVAKKSYPSPPIEMNLRCHKKERLGLVPYPQIAPG